MEQTYIIDRVNIITYKGQRKKKIRSIHNRYIAKSKIVNCDGSMGHYSFVNFRGSHLKKVNFDKANFYGCDFWGVTFNECSFRASLFTDCVFMSCKFKKCVFTDANLKYTNIVNTNIADCKDIKLTESVAILKEYPAVNISDSLMSVLQSLKSNKWLKKNKIFFINDKKVNALNMYLLMQKYQEDVILSFLMLLRDEKISTNIITYGHLQKTLYEKKKNGMLMMSRPTQSRGCDAYGLGDK